MKQGLWCSIVCGVALSMQATPTVAAAGESASVSPSFVQAWHEYLGFYSPQRAAAQAVKKPEAAYALFGHEAGPYEVQDFDPEAAIQADAFEISKEANFDSGCAPFFVRAADHDAAGKSVSFRGTIVAFHGFTACPYEFYSWARELTAQGFNVLAPLTPGMGRAPAPRSPLPGLPLAIDNPGIYYGTYLPAGAGEVDRYYKFVSYINTLVAQLPGRHYSVGLSGGAPLAQYAALETEGLYESTLLLSTFYRASSGYLGRKVPEASSGDGAELERLVGEYLYKFQNQLLEANPEMETGWGQPCYDLGWVGRSGICDFQAKHAQAMDHFGRSVATYAAEVAARRQIYPKTQYVSVEWDDHADTELVRSAYKLQKKAHPEAVSLCFYRDLPHALLSPKDNPGLPMYWLPSLFAQGEGFFASGAFFGHDGPSQEFEENGTTVQYYSLCHLPVQM